MESKTEVGVIVNPEHETATLSKLRSAAPQSRWVKASRRPTATAPPWLIDDADTPHRYLLIVSPLREERVALTGQEAVDADNAEVTRVADAALAFPAATTLHVVRVSTTASRSVASFESKLARKLEKSEAATPQCKVYACDRASWSAPFADARAEDEEDDPLGGVEMKTDRRAAVLKEVQVHNAKRTRKRAAAKIKEATAARAERDDRTACRASAEAGRAHACVGEYKHAWDRYREAAADVRAAAFSPAHARVAPEEVLDAAARLFRRALDVAVVDSDAAGVLLATDVRAHFAVGRALKAFEWEAEERRWLADVGLPKRLRWNRSAIDVSRPASLYLKPETHRQAAWRAPDDDAGPRREPTRADAPPTAYEVSFDAADEEDASSETAAVAEVRVSETALSVAASAHVDAAVLVALARPSSAFAASRLDPALAWELHCGDDAVKLPTLLHVAAGTTKTYQVVAVRRPATAASGGNSDASAYTAEIIAEQRLPPLDTVIQTIQGPTMTLLPVLRAVRVLAPYKSRPDLACLSPAGLPLLLTGERYALGVEMVLTQAERVLAVDHSEYDADAVVRSRFPLAGLPSARLGGRDCI